MLIIGEKSISRSSTAHLKNCWRSPNRIEAVFGRKRSTCSAMYVSTCSLVRLRASVGHTVFDEEHAKPSDGVRVALDRFGRLVGGSERQLKAANEVRNVRGICDIPQMRCESSSEGPVALVYLCIRDAHLISCGADQSRPTRCSASAFSNQGKQLLCQRDAEAVMRRVGQKHQVELPFPGA